MPRRDVRFHTDGYYHIFNRGADRISICRNDGNFVYLLGLIRKYLAECNTTMIAYCLLPNHFHWLVRQDGDIPAGNVAQRVFNSYTRAFNRSVGRTGTLLEGRYRAIEVETKPFLHHLCRYIHGNPVRHAIADTPAMWPYSNYLEWIGTRQGTLVDRSFVEQNFGTPQEYAAYLSEYLIGCGKGPSGLQEYLDDL